MSEGEIGRPTGSELRVFQRAISRSVPEVATGVFDRTLRCRIAAGGGLVDLGTSAEEIEGKTMTEIVGADRALKVDPLILAALDGREGQFEHEEPTLARHFRVRVVPARDDDGLVIGATVVVLDVTDNVLARREEAQLETRMQRGARLEAVGKLAGGVAHDFNNLLAVVLNYSAFVAEALPEDSPLQEDLAEIHRAGERGASLTRQLLILGRREISKPESLDVNLIVANMEKLLRRTLGADIDLTTTLARNPMLVEADAGQLEQVLLALAVNARDAMPDGGRLDLRTDNTELDSDYATSFPEVEPGAYVRLTVSDTGHGIPAHIQDRIFEPFFSTHTSGDATGLGLSAVQGIIAEAGGHVTVYSEEDIGTAFKIHLPATDRRGSEERTDAMPEPIPPISILLAEDDPDVRRMAKRILETAGHRVAEAADGAEGLKLFESDPGSFELLLADVVMPRMSGRELADKIVERRPDLPVIFMSGYTQQMISATELRTGELTLIEKPFTARRLMTAISAAVKPAV
jgi:two-component system cell cycle sensor histidine kinase/response regulator CckA